MYQPYSPSDGYYQRDKTSNGEGGEKLEHFHIADGLQPLWKTVWQFLKKLKTSI